MAVSVTSFSIAPTAAAASTDALTASNIPELCLMRCPGRAYPESACSTSGVFALPAPAESPQDYSGEDVKFTALIGQ
jgi:hypothetical protein